ncbi:hypothetical protein Goari_011343 [Gossypium aridum]|uniref:RNase H type-1 domain-containing protein n=1 Tax=Gossypium aridum TaxID=34290 RepID=A0A7J8WXD3_GOSAI|nr:hypothetical protein [Gossypium aridum]
MFYCGLWGIWFNRNQLVHEGKKLSSKNTADWTTSYLYELDAIKEKSHSRSNVFARWSPLFDAEVKVNFDAAFNLIQTRSGAAEAHACLQAVMLRLQLGVDSVVIERNLKTIINKCKSTNNRAHTIATEGLKKGEEFYLEEGLPEFVHEHQRGNDRGN